jgi:sugar transferase (PEP-CTERM/EpsH1 system associated)
MLTHRLPYPPDRGDRIRSYNLLKLLSRHFDLSVACTSDEPVWLQHHQLLRTMAKQVMIQPISNGYSRVRGMAALAAGGAVTPTSFYRTGLAEQIMQWHEEAPFDAVLTFCTGMIRYARLLTAVTAKGHRGHAPAPRHVLDLVDVDSIKWESYARAQWPPMKWVYSAESRRLRRIESGALDHFDAVTVVSPAEAQAYRDHVGEHPGLAVVGNGVDHEYFSPLADNDSKTVCFVGVLNYKPNADGIAWFVHHVMPLLRQREPEAKVLIVGRHPTPAILALGEQPGVEVVGSVPDVRPFMEQSSAVIAPLQMARGVQNKVLEAMSCRKAVVSSPGAAAGIQADAGKHLLVAESPREWVDHLARVFSDATYRMALGRAARERVEQAYSWEEQLAPMVKLIRGE